MARSHGEYRCGEILFLPRSESLSLLFTASCNHIVNYQISRLLTAPYFTLSEFDVSGLLTAVRVTMREIRLMLPAQTVDATASGALIRQCFRGRTLCLAARDQELARATFLLV
jgi:hypothetical protein